MEDSGIDSEDKVSTNNYACGSTEITNNKMHDAAIEENTTSNYTDVTFREPGEKPIMKQQLIPEASNNNNLSSCRVLQRKLELKVERAKRNYSQYQEENAKKSRSSTLPPYEKLKIPSKSENQPLVDYKSESDEAEEISFFPSKMRNLKKQELSDTFSIQEMTIESDNDNSDDSESQNLELLPPTSNSKFLDKLLNCFYCSDSAT